MKHTSTDSKIFQADDALAETLLKNGYREITDVLFRHSAKQVHLQSVTNGVQHKRAFAIFNKNFSTKTPFIRFERNFIRENGFRFFEKEIGDHDLKAMICFHKLSVQHRMMLQSIFSNEMKLELIGNFFAELKDDDSSASKITPGKFRKKILEVFAGVKI